MKNTKFISHAILLTFLFVATAQAEKPTLDTLGDWQSRMETQLASKEGITKIVVMPKSDALLLKIYYTDGSKSLFKPNTKTEKSMKPGLAVYNLVKNFTNSINVLYTPMVKLSLSVEEVKALTADNPKTDADEVELLNEALSKKAAPVDGMLVGSNATWAEDIKEYGTPFRNTTREGLLSLASRLGTSEGPGEIWDNQVSNLFIMDYISANNDRGGNFHFDPDTQRVWAIDNDDAFVAPSHKKFMTDIIGNLSHVDQNFLFELNTYFSSISDEDMAAQVFTEYSSKEGLRFARLVRARFEEIKARFAR